MAEPFENLVHEAVNRVPSRRNVHVRRVEAVAYIGDPGEIVLVRRGLPEIPNVLMRAPQTVIPSTAEGAQTNESAATRNSDPELQGTCENSVNRRHTDRYG